MLHPMPGHVLVQLGGKYENVTATTKTYEGAITGRVVESVAADESEHFEDDEPGPELEVGLTVYWQEQVTGTRVEKDGKNYAFVSLFDIIGYDDGE